MIKINNWSSYQSYKDRKPPWIRFHKTMLDNFEYHAMSADSRALLPMLWLLASEDDDPVSGLIRCSYEKIAFRLRMQLSTLKKCITELQENSFLQVIGNQACNETVTKPYLNRNQTVTPETETETETEIYIKKIAQEDVALAMIIDWAKENIPTYVNLEIELEAFKNHNYRRKPKNWVTAFKTWLRKAAEYNKPKDAIDINKRLEKFL